MVATLSATQLPAERLVLEITETGLLNSAARIGLRVRPGVLVAEPMSGEALERLIDQPQLGRHAPESPAESGVGHEQSANDLVALKEAR